MVQNKQFGYSCLHSKWYRELWILWAISNTFYIWVRNIVPIWQRTTWNCIYIVRFVLSSLLNHLAGSSWTHVVWHALSLSYWFSICAHSMVWFPQTMLLSSLTLSIQTPVFLPGAISLNFKLTKGITYIFEWAYWISLRSYSALPGHNTWLTIAGSIDPAYWDNLVRIRCADTRINLMRKFYISR